MSRLPTLDRSDAALLAEFANDAASDLASIVLPDDWRMVRRVGPGAEGAQAFLAAGTLPSSGAEVLVIAAGIGWRQLFDFYLDSFEALVPLACLRSVGGPKPQGARCTELARTLLAATLRARSGLRASYATEDAGVLRRTRLLTLFAREIDTARPSLEHLGDCGCRADGDDAARNLGALVEDLARFAATASPAAERRALLAALHPLLLRGSNLVLTSAAKDPARDDVPSVTNGVQLLYAAMEDELWTAVEAARKLPEFAAAMPTVVTGIGPGASLATLAALDLSPQRTIGKTPVTSVASLVFSAAAFGNPAFRELFSTGVPDAQAITITTDHFPLAPGAAEGMEFSPAPTGVQAAIPRFDAPWLERSGVEYRRALEAESSGPMRGSRQPLPRHGSPPGFRSSAPEPVVVPFDRERAYLAACLCSAAYLREQHPSLPFPFPTAPFAFRGDVVARGARWIALFEGPTTIVAAFRGSITWLEHVRILGASSGQAFRFGPSSTGQVMKGFQDLFGELRDAFRAALAALLVASKALVLAGHGDGGSVASLAALDLAFNPIQGAAGLDALFSFGAPFLGDVKLMNSFADRIGERSVQVQRPFDVLTKVVDSGLFFPYPSIVRLEGGDFDPDNTLTFHPISVYVSLLDPFRREEFPRAATGTLLAEGGPHPVGGPLADDARRHFEGLVGFYGLPRVNDPPDLATARGLRTLSWIESRSDLPPTEIRENHRAIFVLRDLVVASGDTLVVESPFKDPVVLVARRLVFERGAALELRASTRVIAGELVVADDAPAVIRIAGVDGSAGTDGPTGTSGANGRPPSGAGGRGGGGGIGAQGGAGNSGGDFEFSFDRIVGTLRVETRGGNGGPGGRGGDGGHGGSGGSGPGASMGRGGDGGGGGGGGGGGNGGPGPSVVIHLKRYAEGSTIVNAMSPTSGGVGGIGGSGGVPGLGHPDGRPGASGPPGIPGRAGSTPRLTVTIDGVERRLGPAGLRD